MAGEELLSVADALAGLPDNLSGLIEAVDSRNAVLSAAPGIASQVSTAVFIVPIVADTPVSINASMGTHDFLANFFIEDGNNSLVSEYPAGVTIAPDLIRLAGIVSVLDVRKAGGGTSVYSFQPYVGGIPLDTPQVITLDATEVNLILSFELGFRPFAAEPMEIRATGVGHSDDIDVVDFRMRVTSIQI